MIYTHMDELTVDRKTLKALGADSRIAILKNLSRKKMTQAELATVLGMAAPSVNEHLFQLQSANLVQQIDNGRKWKYYEITQKGRLIVEPTNVKVWFLLSISLLAIVVSLWQIYPSISHSTVLEMSIPVQEPLQPQFSQRAANQNQIVQVSDSPAQGAQVTSISEASAPFAAIASEENATQNETMENNAVNEIENGGDQLAQNYSELQITRTVVQPSLLDSLPLAETAVFLTAILAGGIALGLLLRKD